MKKKLTKSTIDSAKAENRTYIIFDTELAGYGLKVTPKGKRIFVYQYRVKGSKKSRRITIGTYLDYVQHNDSSRRLTVHVARERAEVFRGKVKSGFDPMPVIQTANPIHLVTTLLDEFLELHVRANLKPLSIEGYERYIEKVIRPEFGAREITEVSKVDIQRLHSTNAKHPCRANHIFAALSKFFNWCEDMEYREIGSNPCQNIKKYRIEGRERFLTERENLRLNEVISSAAKNQTESVYVIAAIQLLRFTGARKNEILKLRWKWVDLDHSVLNLPDSKTGRKRIHLNSSAKDILSALPRVKGNPFVIVGNKTGQHFVNIQKPWDRIRTAAYCKDVRVHDLRHSFASNAVANGTSLHILGKLLGHKQPATTYRYAHLADSALKAANETIGLSFMSKKIN